MTAQDTIIKNALFPDRREGSTFLEQLAVFANCCPNLHTPIVARVDPQNKKIEYVKTACKLWSCPACSARNALKWIARIINGMNNLDEEDWYFATMTSHRKMRGKSSLKNLRSNWPKLVKRMKRINKKLEKPFYYARVWEMHKDGSFHMHLITNCPVTTRWLKDNAASCGMGYQAKIDKTVNAGQAAGYVAKYMVKMFNHKIYEYPKGARRIEVSRNWIAWKEYDNEENWLYVGDTEDARKLAHYYKAKGYTVFDLAVKNLEEKIMDEQRTDKK